MIEMKIGGRGGFVHIIVLIIALVLGIATLLFYRSEGVSLTGNKLRVSPALIGGTVEPSLRK
jgi:hypothetical protein